MGFYDKYSTKRVALSDVLGCLEELQDGIQQAILRTPLDHTDGSVVQLIGRLQGVNQALKRVEAEFGAALD